MTPITHESFEWRQLVQDVADLKAKEEAASKKTEELMKLQATQHDQNVRNIHAVELGIVELVTINKTNTVWLKGIAIMLGLILTLFGLILPLVKAFTHASLLPEIFNSRAPVEHAQNADLYDTR